MQFLRTVSLLFSILLFSTSSIKASFFDQVGKEASSLLKNVSKRATKYADQQYRETTNSYSELVNSLFVESERLGLGYSKSMIHNTINDDHENVFEYILETKGPLFFVLAKRVSSRDNYNLSDNAYGMAKEFTLGYLGPIGCFFCFD